MEMATFSGSLPQQQANTPENTQNLPKFSISAKNNNFSTSTSFN